MSIRPEEVELRKGWLKIAQAEYSNGGYEVILIKAPSEAHLDLPHAERWKDNLNLNPAGWEKRIVDHSRMRGTWVSFGPRENRAQLLVAYTKSFDREEADGEHPKSFFFTHHENAGDYEALGTTRFEATKGDYFYGIPESEAFLYHSRTGQWN